MVLEVSFHRHCPMENLYSVTTNDGEYEVGFDNKDTIT
jgi:hypothetical protein